VLYLILTEDPPALDQKMWSQDFRDFVLACLNKDEGKRLSIDQLLEHPFMKNGFDEEACREEFVGLLNSYKNKQEDMFSLCNL